MSSFRGNHFLSHYTASASAAQTADRTIEKRIISARMKNVRLFFSLPTSPRLSFAAADPADFLLPQCSRIVARNCGRCVAGTSLTALNPRGTSAMR